MRQECYSTQILFSFVSEFITIMHGACSAHCDCLSSTGPPEFEDQCESAMQEVLFLASWFDSTEIAETRRLILHLKCNCFDKSH
jgi:hypothetical protein